MSPDPGGEAGDAVTSTDVRLPPATAAVIFGSGLAAVPDGLTVQREIAYADLGWAVSRVPGHAGRLLVAGDALLANGRGHSYEGQTEDELEAPVRALAAAGVRRLVLTCACGALNDDLAAGDVVIAHALVDLRTSPCSSAPRLVICSGPAARETAAAVAPDLAARSGIYVAVAGPQYETPAEAAWLAHFGDVVGMSAAPEVRAATSASIPVRLLAVVTNRAGASLGHEDVLAAGEHGRRGMQRALARLLDPAVPWRK